MVDFFQIAFDFMLKTAIYLVDIGNSLNLK